MHIFRWNLKSTDEILKIEVLLKIGRKLGLAFQKLPRTSNPTVGSIGKIIRSNRDSSEVVRIRYRGFRPEVVECWNGPVFCGNPEIPAFSDIRQLLVGI